MGYLLFDQDEFWYFKVVEVLSVVAGISCAINELRPGYGLAYSKFTSERRDKNMKKVPSRVGMLIFYTPAALVSLLFFVHSVLFNNGKREGSNTTISSSLKERIFFTALFVHFFKRDLETLFVHRYSGSTGLNSALFISFGYFSLTAAMALAQHKSQQLIPPAVDLTWMGLLVFFIGILGNFYHHWLLRNLRKGDDKTYLIPEGGLFGVFVAPHYIFEIVTFIGLVLISQTYVSVASLTFVTIYLGSRSYRTKQWYRKKIDGFPQSRCAFLPCLV
jgi:hypothetical protein